MSEQHIYSFDQFISSHKAQLLAAGIPERFWETLFQKLSGEVFDAGEHFQILDDEGKLTVVATEDINLDDGSSVFLIDHSWTFRPSDARRQLENVPGLLERMYGLVGRQDCGQCASSGDCAAVGESDDDEVVFEEEKKRRVIDGADQVDVDGEIPRQISVDANLCRAANDDLQVDSVMRAIWRYAQTYTLRYKQELDEEGMPVWYMMDEFGSRIGHSDTPNCRVVPLLFAAQGIAYSVLFPVRKIKESEEVVRDYVDTVVLKQRPEWRHLLLYPWMGGDHSNSPPRQEADKDFFVTGRVQDELASEEEQIQCGLAARRKEGKLCIFADTAQLLNKLDRVDFHLVDDWREADVLWLIKHFHSYRELATINARALVNQFPFESCLTVKDLLAATLLHSNAGQVPSWYQTCFNLNAELPQFVAHFQQRERMGLDNTWIIKPWNLARGLDMHVSNDLAHIIRLIEAGPKIACKYLENPVLFLRPDTGNMVKFDLRFIIFVESLKPVKFYVYNKFWIRFAINQFTLTKLDDIETHFTVFNYNDKSKILQMECDDFVKQLEATYPQLKWADVQQKVNIAMRELLEAVTSAEPPCGVAANAQSRAMYGVDVMLKWNDPEKREVGVSILECNFMPDCDRACVYYPDFADTVFETLFLGRIDPEKVTQV